jgi:hypothetical protein
MCIGGYRSLDRNMRDIRTQLGISYKVRFEVFMAVTMKSTVF